MIVEGIPFRKFNWRRLRFEHGVRFDPPIVLGESPVARLHRILIEEWWPDRSFQTRDHGERKLLAALILAFPDQIHTRERCGCGDSADCDECLSEADVPGLMRRAARELSE